MNYFQSILCMGSICSLAACVAIQPFPGVARAGDTISLIVGSLDGASRNNVTVLYYPDSNPSIPIDITSGVRSILKVFPDKTSKAYYDRESGNGLETMQYQSTISYHGPWQSVVVLDLPASIPVGTGHFQVQFSGDVKYPIGIARVDDVEINMEIIDAQGGGSHDFEYRKFVFNTETSIGDVSKLESARQVVVRRIPTTTSTAVYTAAASYQITVPVLDGFGNDVTSSVANNQFAVVLDDIPDYVLNQTQLSWSRSGDVFNVIVISAGGQQDINLIKFSILISDLTAEATNDWALGGSPALLSVNYYDNFGNLISGPAPLVAVQ